MSATVTSSHDCKENNSTAASIKSCRREGRFAGFRGVASLMMKPIVSTGDQLAAPDGAGTAATPTEETASTDRRRPAHRPSRRLQIVEAATTVFAQEGYVEAGVEDIAKAAGVAPTAIYYHFGGKE